jgi:hypothetical protein
MSLRERCAYHEQATPQRRLPSAFAVSIANDRPHLRRGDYRAHDEHFGLEAILVLCLSGPEAEEEFCGPITDDGDRIDYEMACEYLARQLNPLQVGGELVRCRDAARRLVRSAWAQQRIVAIADALLRNGSLSGDEILG